jgi:hypothetical protein
VPPLARQRRLQGQQVVVEDDIGQDPAGISARQVDPFSPAHPFPEEIGRMKELMAVEFFEAPDERARGQVSPTEIDTY